MGRLIKSISDLQLFVAVNDSTEWSKMSPAVAATEDQLLTYYLGVDLVAELAANYDVDSAAQPLRIQRIFTNARRFVACVGFYKAVPEIEVNVSSDGVTRQESENTKSAYGGQVVRLKDEIANRGYDALDQLLTYMEKQSVDFPEWMDADYYEHKEGLLFKSAKDFSKYESIKSSPLTFMAMTSLIREVPELQFSILPAAMLAELQQQVDTDSLSPDNQQVMKRYLWPALAKLVIEQALIELPVKVDQQGVTVDQLVLNSTDNRAKTTAPDKMMMRKMNALRGKGKTYLYQMSEYLNTVSSAEKYPLWFNSDKYQPTLESRIANEGMADEDRKTYR
jgi:hypothetical protein